MLAANYTGPCNQGVSVRGVNMRFGGMEVHEFVQSVAEEFGMSVADVSVLAGTGSSGGRTRQGRRVRMDDLARQRTGFEVSVQNASNSEAYLFASSASRS